MSTSIPSLYGHLPGLIQLIEIQTSALESENTKDTFKFYADQKRNPAPQYFVGEKV